MRRRIGGRLPDVLGLRWLGCRGWWAVFGAGMLLGAAVLGMKLIVMKVQALNGVYEEGAYSSGKYEVGDNRIGGDEPGLSGLGAQGGGRARNDGQSRIGDAGAGGVGTGTGAGGRANNDGTGTGAGGRANDDKSGTAGTAGRTSSGAETTGSAQGEASGRLAAEPGSAAGAHGPTSAASGASAPSGASDPLDGVRVKVYLSETRKVETVSLESYVLGVLAGEMPSDFELEALKAQAIAARTYMVRRLASPAGGGDQPKGADITDSVQHQVYVSQAELKKRFGSGREQQAALAKLKRAVDETRGLIVTYEEEPIEAAFFSTSNGFTENSEDYWEQELPYLRSVPSPWDEKLSPRYEAETVFTHKELYRKLGMTGKKASGKLSIKVIERSQGNRITRLSINGTAFGGRETREKLGLASSQFSWRIEKDRIIFTTTGFGHGIGMSQWGANGMALEGAAAEDILQHYYTGVKVELASKLPI